MNKSIQFSAFAVLSILLISCSDSSTRTDGDADGTAAIAVTTSGSDKDADGYTLLINESTEEEVAVSDQADEAASEDKVTLLLSPGSHEIELTAVAPNCQVEGDNPVTVEIRGDQTTDVKFTVKCQTALNNKVVLVSDRDGPTDLYVADPGKAPGEGLSNYRKLTNDDYPESNPAISSDGTRIAYVQSGNIWVTNADGTSPMQLTDGGLDREPAWFAGNTKIAFISDRGPIPQLYVMNADGSSETRLATEQVASKPMDRTTPLLYQGLTSEKRLSGSVDKSTPKLILTLGVGDGAEIVALDLDDDGDGIDDTIPITNNNHYDGYPALSPDGTEILIVVEDEKGTKNFRLIDAETGETLSTSAFEPGFIDDQAYPGWAPDGSEILFTSVNQSGAKITSPSVQAKDYNSSRSNKPRSSIEIDTDRTDYNVMHVVWSPAW